MIAADEPAIAERLIDGLRERGLDRVEVYCKAGRSRTSTLEGDRRSFSASEEQGWAVRAGTDRASFFAAATSRLEPTAQWPEPDGGGLELPSPARAEWQPPESLDAPLMSESEAIRLLEHVQAELATELPEGQLISAGVDDGAAEALVQNSLGIRIGYRSRTSSLQARARLGEHVADLQMPAQDPRRLEPGALARRLADRLAIMARGRSPEADRAEVLLAGEAGAAILEGLSPHLIGRAGWRLLQANADRRGCAAAEGVTLIDDGGLATGYLSAPVDGEGVPTRAIRLIDDGRARQPLRPWWAEAPGEISGCSLRPGWRDLPRAGATHLYIAPEPGRPVAELLREIARGYYVVDAVGGCRLDPSADRFELDVIGFRVDEGQPATPMRGARLRGSIRAWFHGVRGVARDLRLVARGSAVFGAPTLLVTGLEVVPV